MDAQTKFQLIDLIKEKGPIGPSKLAHLLQISPQMVHRHLKALLTSGDVQKIGTPPKVFYISKPEQEVFVFPKLNDDQQKYINAYYLVIKPDGRILMGVEGFQWWARKTKQHKNFQQLANEYICDHRKYTKQKLHKLGVIDATHKLQETFEECFLDYLFYKSFYSLPKFGKTKTGQMVTLGKSGQNIACIRSLAELCRKSIVSIVEYFKMDGIIFAPHSIPRKISFLKEFRGFLALPYPCSEINKIFAGGVPVAQKSLTKLADRIENANNTLFLKEENYCFKRILVIDDAVGSGATLNAIARKLKTQASAELVCGFAITGSLKGFDVISEI